MRALLIIALIAFVLYMLFKRGPVTYITAGDVTGGGDSGSGSTDQGGGIFGMLTAAAGAFGDKIKTWAGVTAKQEGYFPGSESYRNNNPGNLVFAGQDGATGADTKGFAVFPTEQVGMAALERDLTAKAEKYPNFSLLQISARYFGGDPMHVPANGEIYVKGKLQGNALTRAQAVAAALGVSIHDTLGSIFGGISNA